MEEQVKKIAELLKTLANERRLLILCTLMKGPHTAGQVYAKHYSFGAITALEPVANSGNSSI